MGSNYQQPPSSAYGQQNYGNQGSLNPAAGAPPGPPRGPPAGGPPNGAFYPGQGRPGGPATNQFAAAGSGLNGQPAPRGAPGAGYGAGANVQMQQGYSSGPPTQFGGAMRPPGAGPPGAGPPGAGPPGAGLPGAGLRPPQQQQGNRFVPGGYGAPPGPSAPPTSFAGGPPGGPPGAPPSMRPGGGPPMGAPPIGGPGGPPQGRAAGPMGPPGGPAGGPPGGAPAGGSGVPMMGRGPAPPQMGGMAPRPEMPPSRPPPGAPSFGGVAGLGGMGGMGPAMGPDHGFGPNAQAMSAALDAFETLTLGQGQAVPGPPGSQQPQQANAAAFPRPAGTNQQKEAALGPPLSNNPHNCNPEFVRFTTNAVPNSQALKSRWHLPYGAIVHPLAETGGPVPVANAGHTTIVRCKRCRTYMNPFMVWMDGGRRYSCNVCQMVNECPVDYFCALDGSGKRLDHDQRPELGSGAVEYLAPAEYMVRAPMPPTFVFLIDVSFASASSGMIQAACDAIKANLGSLPGDDRTRVAVITFDKSIHFYNMRAGLENPQMMVVGEIDDPFVPLPDELLVNLSESRGLVEKLLDSIPKSFAQTQIVDSAMGPALQAAFLVMNHVGGKLVVFQTGAPSAGIGKIKARDNPAMYGTDREYTLRCPDDPFYKRFSAEASRFQICIDVYAGGSVYQDLPSLGALCKYTGGQMYYYPGFTKDKDGRKLHAELKRNVSREIAWESVMRIRCSKGLRISNFFGNFFVRSTDLLALPACDADKTFAVEITHEETLVTGQSSYLQAALLYTSSQGERRIRVLTMSVPIVPDLIDMYKACDTGCTAALMAKINVEKALSTKLEVVRSGIQGSLVAALREYRMLHMRGTAAPHPGSMVLPERLKSLPVMALGLMKSSALRGGGRDVNTDERAAVSASITTGRVHDIVRLLYPSCYRVDQEGGPWGTGTGDSVVLPTTTPAGLEYFDPTGAYLVDNGRVIVLWLGSAMDPQKSQKMADIGGNQRLVAVIESLKRHKDIKQEVHVVKQGTPMEAHVMPYFIEDRLGPGGMASYLEWMTVLQKGLMAGGGGAR